VDQGVRTENEAWGVPVTLKELIAGRELVEGLDAVELREMSKFTELPNVWGLAAHPILFPYRETGDAAWDERVRTAMAKLVGMFPLIVVRGWVGGEALQAFVPQNHARVAAGLAALMRGTGTAGVTEGGERVRTLAIWPEGPRDKRGRAIVQRMEKTWGDEELTVLIGTDDLAAGLRAVGLEQAARESGRLLRVGELDAAGRRAALGVGTVLFGVGVDVEGHVPPLEGEGVEDAGWVVMG
jgi:hypothetical protein